MPALASIGATGSGRLHRFQVVRRPINGGRDTATPSQIIEGVFVDVPFNTRAVRPSVHSNHRPGWGSSCCLNLDEFCRYCSVGGVGFGGSEIQAEMGQEICRAGHPRCTKRMSIGKVGDAPPASALPDAVAEAVSLAITIVSAAYSTAARHSRRAIDG